jgi:hypothetical protein
MYKKGFVRDKSVQQFNIGGNRKKSKQKKGFVRDKSVQQFNIGGNRKKSKQKKGFVRDKSVQQFNIGGNRKKSKQKKGFVRDKSVQQFNIGGSNQKSKKKLCMDKKSKQACSSSGTDGPCYWNKGGTLSQFFKNLFRMKINGSCELDTDIAD